MAQNSGEETNALLPAELKLTAEKINGMQPDYLLESYLYYGSQSLVLSTTWGAKEGHIMVGNNCLVSDMPDEDTYHTLFMGN